MPVTPIMIAGQVAIKAAYVCAFWELARRTELDGPSLDDTMVSEAEIDLEAAMISEGHMLEHEVILDISYNLDGPIKSVTVMFDTDRLPFIIVIHNSGR